MTRLETLPDRVRERLAGDTWVREALPGGELYFDRPLPFLCVHRRDARDFGTETLVKGEAAYLVASGDDASFPELKELVRTVVDALSERFDAFLLVELWAAPLGSETTFRLFVERTPPDVVQRLREELTTIRVLGSVPRVEVVREEAPLVPRLAPDEAEVSWLGLEVAPIFYNQETEAPFPLLLRALDEALSTALKCTLYAFVKERTRYRPAHYHALGRQRVMDADWEVDKQLTEMSDTFDFLLDVTPVNAAQAWERFQVEAFSRAPEFLYRPLAFDPEKLKGRLYGIDIDRVEDSTLAKLFREQRAALARKLTMLEERNTPRFLYGSLQLYGGVDDELSGLAEGLLAALPERREGAGEDVGAETFAARAREELEHYRKQYPALASEVKLRDDVAGLMVVKGNLLVSRRLRIPTSRVEALLQHEVGTHIVTYVNGRAQRLQQLYAGLSGYDELQEGLAVLAEYLVDGLSRARLRLLAARVVAVRRLVEGATFLETFHGLKDEYGVGPDTAFNVTMRVYRSGGLTKDAVYLRGLVRLLEYLQGGGPLEPLFVGKITAEGVPLIEELRYRGVLRDMPLRPRYLAHPKTPELLAALREGRTVLDLMGRQR